MHRFFLETQYQPSLRLTGDLAHYILNVLRMQVGEELELVTDEGIVCSCRIREIGSGWLWVQSLAILAEPREANFQVTLAQGLAKGEKMDLVMQKGVELGAAAIIPVAMDNSVVKLTGDKAEKKLERWRKVIQNAAQQSRRDIVPALSSVCSFEQALQGDYDLILLAYEGETRRTLKSVLRGGEYRKILVLIGPEGGISEKELALALSAGAQVVSLGRRILRTETAGLVVLSNIFYELT